MLFFLTFLFIKESKKKYHRFQKNIKQHNSLIMTWYDLNTDNKSA